jgi:sugar phosphate isomerase/epimerase
LASLRLPFSRALAQATALGGHSVEIDGRDEIKPRDLTQTATRQLRKLLDDRKLRVCAVEYRTRRGYNVRDDLDRRVDATKQAMSMAYALGAGVVVNHIGRIPQEPKGTEWELLVETLDELGRHGQRCGAMLAAQTGAESGQDLARLLEALPEGSLGVAFDPGALILNGFSPSESLAALAARVVHFYATDAVHDLAKGRGVETLLGEGVADYPGLLGMLEEHDYSGSLVVDAVGAENPVFEMQQAIAYFKQLL